MNAFIRLLYALLVALSVVAFAGLAIFSFYQPPKSPTYSDNYYSADLSDAQVDKEQRAYDQADKKYQKDQKTYQRNVTLTLLPIAAVVAVGGLYLMRKRSEVIGEGLALGGVAISIYAIITASIAEARILRFAAATILLIIVLLVAHFRFSPALSKKA